MYCPVFLIHCLKHPHERGEDHPILCSYRCTRETPPREWGRRVGGVVTVDEKRNTPTNVGKTHLKWNASDSVSKHPHEHGEGTSKAGGGAELDRLFSG
jgi:hypothetical protein